MVTCERRDREEFVALCPKVTAMETSFYRWRKDAKVRREREQGLFEGGKNEEDEVGGKDMNSFNIDTVAAPVVERDQTEMKLISTTSGNGKIYHQFSKSKIYQSSDSPV